MVQVLRKRKRNTSEEGGGNPQQRKSKAKIRITEYTPVTRIWSVNEEKEYGPENEETEERKRKK